ncbi:hypothetical protein [Mitsuaria sp. CC2]|uniref:hypothetical protein n=1 Tax=Mitsuaria sp. CC2 TaxID=3029186 RepID=UPI003B9DF7DF
MPFLRIIDAPTATRAGHSGFHSTRSIRMSCLLFSASRWLPCVHADLEPSSDAQASPRSERPAADRPLEAIGLLVKRAIQLKAMSEPYPSHFRDLRQQLDAVIGELDRISRDAHQRRARPATIAGLEAQIATLEERFERREARVRGWAARAHELRVSSSAMFSFARPPGARSPAPG